jgi:translocation and assembly module TamB
VLSLLARIASAVASVAVLLVGAYAFLGTETALKLAIDFMITRSDGRLAVEEPVGSLWSTVRVKRLTWKGPEATLSADEIALDWTPAALLSRGIVVEGLGAQRIDLAIVPSTSASAPPASLALPIDVVIDKIAVGTFAWQVGTSSGTITGLAFGYSGGGTTHRVDRLEFISALGSVTGTLSLGARSPFPVDGKLAFIGDAILKGVNGDAAISGTLAATIVEAKARARDASFALSARLTPLATVAIDALSLDAEGVDLSLWHEALPPTSITVKAKAQPRGSALEGALDVVNALSGPIDAHRVPLRSLHTRFSWSADMLSLDELSAELSGGGRATGQARVPTTGDAGKWTLDIRDVDLRSIYTPLVTTRLSGTLGADLATSRQQIEGSVVDRRIAGGISLSFAAAIAEGKLAVDRLRIRAGNGELAGSGRIDLANRHEFELRAKATKIDPAHFGAFPAGGLDGDIALAGALSPVWRVDVKAALAAGSRFAGVALAGSARATVAPRTLRDAAIDLKIASARLTATGSAGGADDQFTATLDARELAELAPLLPAQAPHPLTGQLHAKLDVHGDLERGGALFEANGRALHVGSAVTLGTLDAHAEVARPSGSSTPLPPEQRHVAIELGATGVVIPQGTFPRARATVAGTLAQHTATLAFAGADLDVDAKAHGSLTEAKGATGDTGWGWSGTIDTLENRGVLTLRLAAPATLDVTRHRVSIGAARLDVADGKVELASFAWDEGRITTRGACSGVPLTTAAGLAGVTLPLASTLTFGCDWSLAATPALNGSLTIHRERGDIMLSTDAVAESSDRAFHVTALELSAQFHDDAIDAVASVRSERGMNADAKLSVGVAAGASPGHIAANAPVSLALNADLATLRALQPWVGTAAVVDGSLHAEITARGTVEHALLSGAIKGNSLRIEAPQRGLYLTDGRLSARLADGVLTLEELSFAAGSGRFTASGSVASPEEGMRNVQTAAGHVTWHAENFRVFNRPDLRLVVGGSGTIAMKDRKLALGGMVTVVEGHIEYVPDPSAVLGDDVVVKGRPMMGRDRARLEPPPLEIDLDLDLGNSLTFAGEGLETGLRGSVHVTVAGDGVVRGRGSIRAVNGTYFAFGQRLTIDRGQLIFDGPLDNPGLDIVALRKNLAVEAGVAVTGTVRVPIIQLTSSPPVPENEKLSWLVLGRGLDSTNSADMAALQAASAALLGGSGKPVTTRMAQSIGLDDISIASASSVQRSAARGGTSTTTGQVVTFGKRLTDRLTLVYEQGLSIANNALRLEYSLTRSITLRAEAGAISGVGIFYRHVFD